MNLLDRSIAWQFLMNIVVLTVILCCFVVAVDVSLNLDRFQDAAANLREAGQAAPGAVRQTVIVVLIVWDLWWPRLLQLFNFLVGIIMVGAMGFTCSQLVRNREVIAMLAAGQSLYRVMRPIGAVAVGITLLQAANQELVIPRLAPLLARDHGSAGQPAGAESPVAMTADRSILLRAENFNDADDTIEGLFILVRGADGRAERVIRAPRASWRDGGWDLEAGIGERRGTGRTAIERVERVETAIDPARIVMDQNRAFEQALGFGQVSRMLGRPELVGDDLRERLERIRWGRFAVMGCNLLSLLIAMPFYLSRVPTGILGRTLRSLPLVGLALVGGVLGASGSVPGLPAVLGVFVPVALLLPLAVGAATMVKT